MSTKQRFIFSPTRIFLFIPTALAAYFAVVRHTISTPRLLKAISVDLGASNFQILAIVKANEVFVENHIPLTELLLNLAKMFAGIDEKHTLTDEDLDFIIKNNKSPSCPSTN